MKNLQKLGFQMELLFSNSELSMILMILPNDHQHILQPQRMFENLATLYAKRVKCVTDTPVKNALTSGTTWGMEQIGKELCWKDKKEKHTTFLERDSQKLNAKIQNIQNCRLHWRRLWWYFLLQLSWFIQRTVDLVHGLQVVVSEECPDGSPNCVWLNLQFAGNETLY